LAERVIDVFRETVRRWALKFGTTVARSSDEDGVGRREVPCIEGYRAASLFQVLRTLEDSPGQFPLTTSQFTLGRCSTLV
jgi:hypothetical protein